MHMMPCIYGTSKTSFFAYHANLRIVFSIYINFWCHSLGAFSQQNRKVARLSPRRLLAGQSSSANELGNKLTGFSVNLNQAASRESRTACARYGSPRPAQTGPGTWVV